MVHLTDDKIKELLEDEDVVKRISDFVSMGEAAFFEEVRLASPRRSWRISGGKSRTRGNTSMKQKKPGSGQPVK